jgi:hypothetical protein
MKIKIALKQKRNRLIIFVYKKITDMFHKYISVTSSNNEFEDLAPIIEIEKIDPDMRYRKTLDYVFSNENIFNIALTGPYGSGKSSLLKGYFENNIAKKEKCLFISLSTFQNRESEKKINGTDHIEPISEIESSILEQIIYTNEEQSQNYSRIKRINAPKSQKMMKIYLESLFLVASLGSLLSNYIDERVIQLINIFVGFFWNMSFSGIFNIESEMLAAFLMFCIVTIDIRILFCVFRKLWRISRISFSFDKASINLHSEGSSSLLDKYIDEIYNFFKHNDYHIVVFEDLDRYDNVDIFERLKRINRIVNQDSDDKKNCNIKFVYTIGDHMFSNENYTERTKFFDFVLPVIPIIDISNSYSMLKQRFDKLTDKKIENTRFLKDISFYIDDMRTLKNIMNEYIMFYDLLYKSDTDTQFSEKIFSIICLKNRYPSEFAQLQKREGSLITFIEEIDKKRKENIEQIEGLIKEIDSERINFNAEKATSVLEIKDIFRMAIHRRMRNQNITLINKAGQNGGNISVQQIISYDNLEHFFGMDKIRINNTVYQSAEVSTLWGTSLPYNDRIKNIALKNEKALEEMNHKKDRLFEKLSDIRHASWSEVLKQNDEALTVVDFKKKYGLIFYFLFNGYIENDYNRYIGYFREGFITKKDLEFITSVKSRLTQDFDSVLDNPKIIIDELVTENFQSRYVWNYGLVKYILSNRDDLIALLINEQRPETAFIVEFINGYIRWSQEDLAKDNTCRKLIQHVYGANQDYFKSIIENELLLTETENMSINIVDYSVICELPEIFRLNRK